jgi:hypothetical protein
MKKIVLIIFVLITNSVYSQVVFNYQIKYFQRNDTMFRYKVYCTENRVDSVSFKEYLTKLSKSRWKDNMDIDSSYVIYKLKKKKPTKWFKENNKYINADYECDIIKWDRCYKDGRVQKFRRFWHYCFIRTK